MTTLTDNDEGDHSNTEQNVDDPVVVNLLESAHLNDQKDIFMEIEDSPFKCKLEWKNVSLWVKYPINPRWYKKNVYGKKQILKNVSGVAISGEMWVIMGATGGGKTTLLNILSQRKTKGVTGEIFVNEKPVDKNWKRKIGYVVQDDILFPTLTVYQTFTYQAKLRLPKSMPLEVKMKKVDTMIDALGLTGSKHTYVGNSMIRGISGGERKRVSIGIQLLSGAGVIFLDEPTSGLDKSTATFVLKLMKKFSQKGYLVLTTIHQPSKRMFNYFDKAIFVIGGEVAYQGPVVEAEAYFNTFGITCPLDENPIDNVMSLLINSANSDLEKIIIEKWREKEASSTAIDEKVKNFAYEDGEFNPYPAGTLNQFFTLSNRSMQLNLISLFSSMNIIQIIVIGVLFGLIWLRVEKTPSTINDRVGALFFVILFAGGFNPVLNVLYSFPTERSVIVRERSEGAYPISIYFLAKTISDAPFEQIFPLLFILISWWIVGLDDKFTTFLLVWVVLIFLCLSSSGLGLMISSIINDVRTSTIFATIFLLSMVMTAGFYISWVKIPVWVRWIGYLSYIKYAFDGLVYVVIGDPRTFPQTGGRQLTLFVRNYGATIGILIGFLLFFRFVAYIFLRLTFKEDD